MFYKGFERGFYRWGSKGFATGFEWGVNGVFKRDLKGVLEVVLK